MCLRISKGKVGASTKQEASNDRWLCPGKSHLASLKLDFPPTNGMVISALPTRWAVGGLMTLSGEP